MVSGVWDFPGGHIEDDEQPNDALRRELLEEIGVDIGSRPPELELDDQEAGFELSLWVVDDWHGEIHNLQPEEHDDRWLRTSDLASLTFADDAYRSFLAALLSR